MMGDLVRLLIGAVLVSTCVVARSGKLRAADVVLEEGEKPLQQLNATPPAPELGPEMTLPEGNGVGQTGLPEVTTEEPETTSGEDSMVKTQFKGRRDLQKRHIHGPTVDDANIKIILDLHNIARGQVEPTAKYMAKMYWSAKLAESAQALANECREVKHDDAGERRTKSKLGVNIGQNYALGNNATGWSNIVDAWHGEKKDFTYGVNVAAPTGHYTQMVRGPTTHVGCGSAHCPNLETGDEPLRSWYCNYVQMNMNYIYPYELGETCEVCKDKCTDNGLCDCGADFLCQYGSIPDYNTCTCKCEFGFHGANCTECPLVDMGPLCPNWSKDQCGKFTNVPDQCPVMCGECPKKCSNDDLRCKNGGVLTEVGDGTCKCVCPVGYSGEKCTCETAWTLAGDNEACGRVDLDYYCTFGNIRDTVCKFNCNCT